MEMDSFRKEFKWILTKSDVISSSCIMNIFEVNIIPNKDNWGKRNQSNRIHIKFLIPNGGLRKFCIFSPSLFLNIWWQLFYLGTSDVAIS